MMDNKLVYRIGKYVVVHVDEKLYLKDVADGVFLNSGKTKPCRRDCLQGSGITGYRCILRPELYSYF